MRRRRSFYPEEPRPNRCATTGAAGRRTDAVEQAAMRLTAEGLILAGWTPATAWAYAARAVRRGSRGLTQNLEEPNWRNIAGRRTPAGGAWTGANAELTSGEGRRGRAPQQSAQRSTAADRAAVRKARRDLADVGTPRQREAHVLVRVQGLRPAEAARRLNIGRQTVADLLAKFDRAFAAAKKNGHMPGD